MRQIAMRLSQESTLLGNAISRSARATACLSQPAADKMLHKTAAGISGKPDAGHSTTPCWWPQGRAPS